MKQFFMLFVAALTLGRAQSDTLFRLLDYRLSAAVDEKESGITGQLSVLLQATGDSVSQWTFETPHSIEINNVVDRSGHSYSIHRNVIQPSWNLYTVETPFPMQQFDTFFVSIDFSETTDSSGSSLLFINQKEFLLSYSRINCWIPFLHETNAANASVEITADSSFTVLTESPPEPEIVENGRKRWRWGSSSSTITGIATVCGLKNIAEYSSVSDDSLFSISLFVDPDRFHSSFARALAAQLTDAAGMFAGIGGHIKRPFKMKFVFIGDDDINESSLTTGRFVIEKNSPKHLVFDSTIFTQSSSNTLLQHLAGQFVPLTRDSDAVLSTGWSGYLATRYILSTNSSAAIERRERLEVMTNALSFFPSDPIGAGEKPGTHNGTILSYKGRYFFLMLEYLLGQQAFDSVSARMFRQFDHAPVTVDAFQRLCEEEYGSPLQWFFQEWLYRPTEPEYVFQWKSEKTQRGIHIVTVLIEQRGDIYSMPVPLSFSFGKRTITKRVIVDRARQEFSFQFDSRPTSAALDPDYKILRWLLETRILAHARSSRLFRIFNRDLTSSEKEARLTLQLDPDNITGTAPIAYFSLAKISVINNDREQAKEYLLSAMQSSAADEAAVYPLMSLVRYGNILEMEGNRDEAVTMYQRALLEGKQNPLVYAPVIIEAEQYLRSPFISTSDFWYGLY